MSFLVRKNISVYHDHYQKLRQQKGHQFNFSQWVRSCIANEIGEDVDFNREAEIKEKLDTMPRVKLQDGRELVIIDQLQEEAEAQMSEDEIFVQQVEEWVKGGYRLPEKTRERYEEAKKRLEKEA